MLSRFMTRREQLVLFFVGCSIMVGSVAMYVLRDDDPEENATPTTPPAMQTTALSSTSEEPDATPNAEDRLPLVISVQGAVKHPGVYRFAEDERVMEAIASAEGLQSDADTSSLNLAAKLIDGTTLYIPKRGDDDAEAALAKNHAGYVLGGVAATGGIAIGNSSTPQININTASAEELERLPGIGEAYAQAIILYLNARPFTRVEDIMSVRGIGEKRFESIRDQITVQ